MRHENVTRVAGYYRCIPEMRRLLSEERNELEREYYALGAVEMDGMPRSPTVGRPAEAAGLRAARDGVDARLREIAESERILMTDYAAIRACIDTLNGRYKQIIMMRYVHRYSRAKIGVRLGAPESTTRDWHRRAVKRLGETLDELADVQGVVERALRART